MAGRQKLGGIDTDYAKTPGPAGYPVMSPDNYQKKAPAYSMLSRQFMPGGMYRDKIVIIIIIASSTIILFISGWSKFFDDFNNLVVLTSRSLTGP